MSALFGLAAPGACDHHPVEALPSGRTSRRWRVVTYASSERSYCIRCEAPRKGGGGDLYDPAQFADVGPQPAIGRKNERLRVAGQLAFEILQGFRLDHILGTLALL